MIQGKDSPYAVPAGLPGRKEYYHPTDQGAEEPVKAGWRNQEVEEGEVIAPAGPASTIPYRFQPSF